MDQNILSFYAAGASEYETKMAKWPLSAIRTSESFALMNLIADIKGSKILELGCGTGFYTRKLIKCDPDTITAVDAEKKMLDMLPNSDKITTIHSTAEKLILEPRFNLIFSAGMLEFVDNPLQVLDKCRDLIVENGSLVLLVPTRSITGFLYKLYHKRNGIKINLFEINSFKRLAKSTGWKVEKYLTCGLFSYAIKLAVV